MAYSEIDPRIFNQNPDSTWINLGLWTGNCSYEKACERLAESVGEMVQMKASSSVLDVGCGNGDSLLLWKRMFQAGHICGVNISPTEVAAARSLTSHDEDIVVCKGDARSISSLVDISSFSHVVCVDCAYHFDTRKEFLEKLFETKKTRARLGVADLVLSCKWEQGLENSRSLWDIFLRSPYRAVILKALSVCAGIPFANLVYGPAGLEKFFDCEKRSSDFECRVVTDRVLLPFSSHLLAKECGSWAALFQVRATGLFLRIVAWLGCVDFVLYSCSIKEEGKG